MVMNERKPPFDNIKVRQAVMHAVNRDFIVKNIFFGLARVATGPVSSTTPFYEKDVPVYDYNPKKAKALIEASGVDVASMRSEEHTSELQSLMRISYAVFCLKKKSTKQNIENN